MTFTCLNNCAECCGCITINKEIFNKHKDKVQVGIKEMRYDSESIYPNTDDGLCCFLNRQSKRCEIYDDRPDVCIRFGTGIDQNGDENVLLMCPHLKPSGNMRSEANKKHLARRVRDTEDLFFKKMKEMQKNGKQ